MTQYKPAKVWTLGDYYRDPGLRGACHAIKNGDIVTMRSLVMDFIDLFQNSPPKDCVLVPVPSLSGHNETFCRLLGDGLGIPVRDNILKRSDKYGSLYDMKQKGITPTEALTGIQPGRGDLPKETIILVDNVIATGVSVSASIAAIGRPCEALCVAVDWNTYSRSINK